MTGEKGGGGGRAIEREIFVILSNDQVSRPRPASAESYEMIAVTRSVLRRPFLSNDSDSINIVRGEGAGPGQAQIISNQMSWTPLNSCEAEAGLQTSMAKASRNPINFIRTRS